MIRMPSFHIGPEPDAYKHFSEHLGSLTRFDIIRVNELLELIQYNVIYCISAFIGGLSINTIFPEYNETVSIGRLSLEIIGELLALVIVVFYIRRFVKTIPFLFHLTGSGPNGFKPYLTTEYQGEIALGIIFVGVQFRLIRKLALLANKLGNAIFDSKAVGEVHKMQQMMSGGPAPVGIA